MKKKKAIYSIALAVLGFIIGAVLFSNCGGKSAVSVNLKAQYDGLQSEYLQLLNSKKNIDLKLQQKTIELIEAKEVKAKEVVNHGKTYKKGKAGIINNPGKDSLHLAAYDSLNASCERVQARDNNVIKKSDSLNVALQSKVSTQDSTITNRNAVIKLDGVSIALCRDSLRASKKKVFKAFLIGVGVGAAAREAVNVGIKLIGK